MNEIEILLTQILNCSYEQLYFDKEINLSCEHKLLEDAIERRLKGEPLAYILGKTEFMGLELRVKNGVFIPRPETEILVEQTMLLALKLCQHKDRYLKILDLATGSGCIAVSLAKYLDNLAKIYAVDICPQALAVAKLNACLHQVKVGFLRSDLLQGLKYGSFDIIVSNPPYISAEDIDKLPVEISYEPRRALWGGRDGLRFFRRIIREAPFYLNTTGYLLMEIGFGQLNSIKNIFKKIKNLRIIDTVKDYNNIDRIIVAQKYVQVGD